MRPSYRLMIEVCKEVAKEYPDVDDWPRLKGMAETALAAMKREDAVDAAGRAGGNTIHTDSGRTPPPHNPGGFPGR